MNLQGILKTDELITRFFRLSTEMCVDLSYRVLMDQTLKSPTVIRAKCFHTLDAYVRLIALLVKHSGDTQNTVTKVNLLNKVRSLSFHWIDWCKPLVNAGSSLIWCLIKGEISAFCCCFLL